MVNLQLTDYILIFLGIWLALLNFYLLKVIRSYKSLTKGSGKVNLEDILKDIIKKQGNNDKRLSELASEILKIQNLNELNFQKSALIRFNPFEDSGGDQSFVAAFLNGKNDGIVISSLHSRNGTRVYAKQVTRGKAMSHQFSKEEKEVVEKAGQLQNKTVLKS